MKVILISGHAQHGKDTAAKIMQTRLRIRGYRVLITHYADLLKFMCKQYFDWDGEKDEHGRALLQRVGTDIVRAKNPDFWVEYMAAILGFFQEEWDVVIIPDTRFPNEVDMLRDRGFDVVHVRVVRPDFENDLTPEQRMHPSETALDDVEPDAIINNGGAFKVLYDNVTTFLQENVYESER